jgi:hypothetical protein
METRPHDFHPETWRISRGRNVLAFHSLSAFGLP